MIFNAMLVVVDGLGGVVEEVGYLPDVGHTQPEESKDALLGTKAWGLAGVTMGRVKKGVQVIDKSRVEREERFVELLENGVKVV